MKLAVLLAFLTVASVHAESDKPKLPPELQDIGIQQKLDSPVPLDTVFRDEDAREVRLGSYFGQRPVLLALVYYRCPMLCSQILSGVVSGLRPLRLTAGKDFDVVAVSFDPEDTPQTAREKRDEYTRRYHRGVQGWHFLTGNQESIHALTEAVGFHYRFDEKSNMFIHASGVMILTPAGHVARYFYGVEYEPKDLKLGLIEASGNRIGSPVDQVLLFCYHYDPATGKYGAAVMNLLLATAALVLAAMIAVLTILWRRDIRRDRQQQLGEAQYP